MIVAVRRDLRDRSTFLPTGIGENDTWDEPTKRAAHRRAEPSSRAKRTSCRRRRFEPGSVKPTFTMSDEALRVKGEPNREAPAILANMFVCSLSGNEIFCLQQKGFFPGEIVVGNSVRSLGLAGAIGSGFRTLAGGEVENVTALISEGR